MRGTFNRFVGAHPVDQSSTEFCVWAPDHESVVLHLVDTNTTLALDDIGDGYFAATTHEAPVGTTYRFVIDGDQYPDPASRFQPEGVHGPSEVVDLGAFRWSDDSYHQRPLWDHVIYELHVGTFSDAGTFDGALKYLDSLVELGVSAIEVMPVAQFPGTRNWGYDGVFPNAVQHSYGGPVAFQLFVDGCHQRGLAVVLDVVYNHLGPEGNVFGHFAPYFSDRYRTPWGDAINFDGDGSNEVREYFWQNARQWFADFHVDALRLDAVHAILDQSAIPFMAELSRRSHDLGELLERRCDLIAESAANDPRVVTPLSSGGLGLDAQWNDDFHHTLHVAVTGEHSGYYVDYSGVDDLARALDEGFALQGTQSTFRGCRHGAPSGHLAPERFVVFAQNHDHIGNRPLGDRLSTTLSPAQAHLVAALVVLGPNIPLLFMGEEYGERAPFPYFVDHSDPALIEAVRVGRAREFRDIATADELFDPEDVNTFTVARLDHSLREEPGHREQFGHYQRLIALRRSTPALRRSARSQARAWSDGNIICLVRSHDDGDVAALFNVGPRSASATLPAKVCWRDLLAETGDAESPITLEPWSFRVFQSGSVT